MKINNKKLILFNPSIEDGGVEKNLYIIGNYLTQKFKNISIINSNPEKKIKFNKKIRFISPTNKFWHHKPRYYKYFICLVLLIIELIKNKKNKMLVFSFQANIYCIIICMLFNVKIIIRSNTSPSGWNKSILKNIIFKFFFQKADMIISNSELFKNQLEKKFNINVNCIYNPLDLHNIIKKSKININIPFFKSKKFLKVVTVGRLVDQKDHTTLIKSIFILKNKIPIKLIILGQGKLKAELENLINALNLQDNIKLIGYRNNPYNYIKKSDLFVLSSKFEGLPNVLIETLALKKFIISSNCDTGPSEILKDGQYGDLFEVGDHKELAKKITNFFYNNKKFKNKIIKAYKSLYRFDFKNNCEKYYLAIKKTF
jgi:glycosyltransferase involved in cell wall biosynthesis